MTLIGIRREASAFALSSACIADLKLLTFLKTTAAALQIVVWRIPLRLSLVTVYGLVPFIFSSRFEVVVSFGMHGRDTRFSYCRSSSVAGSSVATTNGAP